MIVNKLDFDQAVDAGSVTASYLIVNNSIQFNSIQFIEHIGVYQLRLGKASNVNDDDIGDVDANIDDNDDDGNNDDGAFAVTCFSSSVT